MIYGAGATGRELASILAHEDDARPVAFIDDDTKPSRSKYRRDICLSEFVCFRPRKVTCGRGNPAGPPGKGRRRRSEIVKSLAGSGLSVRTLPNYTDLVQGRMSVSEVRDLSIDEILGRDAVDADKDLMRRDIAGNAVLVTGAGGSIGTELCRQIILNEPTTLVLLEQTEFTLYQIYEELKKYVDAMPEDRQCQLVMVLGSVHDGRKIEAILSRHSVTTIYHAAAYKHVPIVEDNPIEGVRNNILGTLAVAQAACAYGVNKFVLISTDKAVRPTSIMGASKRMAEMVLQALDQRCDQTIFAIVRFGNVLGSSGSVVPLFRQQIRDGGPITLTHRDVTRYFMTITEAAQLVIQAGAMTVASMNGVKGAPVYLLDMGAPVRIVDLAERMIELSGLTVFDEDIRRDGDIEIKEIGLRPGEKLHEELLIGGEVMETSHQKIKVAAEEFMAGIRY